jgi:hypothetical protein
MQSFVAIPDTQTLTNSRIPLLDNTRTVMSCSSGGTFPTAELQIGMLCYRSDQNKLYELKSTSPATWIVIADLSKTYLSQEAAVNQFQPLDVDLTAIAAIASNGVPKRTGAGAWSVIPQTGAGEALMTAWDAGTQRWILGLGSAAVLNASTNAGAWNVVQADGNGNVGLGGWPVDGYKLTVYSNINTTFGVIGNNAQGNKFVSSGAPSGGGDGDIWYQV